MIESNSNNKIKDLKRIFDPKRVKNNHVYAIEGFTMLEEALSEGLEIIDIFLSDNFENEFLGRFDIRDYNLVKSNVLRNISKTVSGKELIAIIKKPKPISLEKVEDEILLLLDGVRDPGNMGTIIRTADAFGIKHILLINNNVNVYNDKVLRSTMGSIFRVNTIEIEKKDLFYLKDKGYCLIATSPIGEKAKFFKGKKILILGNEASGISNSIFNLSDKRVAIPMKGNAESLNVAVAAAISMFIFTEE